MIPPASLVLGALLLAPAAVAQDAPRGDAWEPWTARRVSSPEGRHYLVLRPGEEGGGPRFELVRRRDGAAPLPTVVEPLPGFPVPGEPVRAERDPEDRMVASGTLPQIPFLVRVLDREPGAVLFERYGRLGGGDALAVLGADGKPRWRLALSDLFQPEAVARFPRRGDSVWWFQAFWVDEERKRVVLLAAGDRFGEVGLEDGRIRAADPSVLLTRALEGPLDDRVIALELAARFLPEGIAEAAGKVAADGRAPLSLRVRAALALRRKGVETDFAPLFRAAVAARGEPLAREFAVRHLVEVLGPAALPLLRDSMRGVADGAWRPAMAALAELGEGAVPTLLEMLAEKDQSLDYRGGAATVLGEVGAVSALPALWKAATDFDPAGDPHHFVPSSALEAILVLDPPDLRARLLALLREGTGHDARVARWLEERPGEDAVPPLLDALDRTGEFTWERRRVLAALKACTGRDLGPDPAKWREAFGGR